MNDPITLARISQAPTGAGTVRVVHVQGLDGVMHLSEEALEKMGLARDVAAGSMPFIEAPVSLLTEIHAFAMHQVLPADPARRRYMYSVARAHHLRGLQQALDNAGLDDFLTQNIPSLASASTLALQICDDLRETIHSCIALATPTTSFTYKPAWLDATVGYLPLQEGISFEQLAARSTHNGVTNLDRAEPLNVWVRLKSWARPYGIHLNSAWITPLSVRGYAFQLTVALSLSGQRDST